MRWSHLAGPLCCAAAEHPPPLEVGRRHLPRWSATPRRQPTQAPYHHGCCKMTPIFDCQALGCASTGSNGTGRAAGLSLHSDPVNAALGEQVHVQAGHPPGTRHARVAAAQQGEQRWCPHCVQQQTSREINRASGTLRLTDSR